MERVDLDINTPISIEEDVVSVEELMGLIESMLMGPTLMVHIVNTGMRIMSARYLDTPARLSRSAPTRTCGRARRTARATRRR